MTEPGPDPDAGERAEVCALADGRLPVERRAELEAHVAASPRLTALLERQRRALAALAVVADEPVPATLTATVEAAVAGARRDSRPATRIGRWRGRRLALRLSAAVAFAAAWRSPWCSR